MDFVGVKKYITKICSNLFELLNTFNIDLIADGSGDNRLISHIVFNKLPNLIKKRVGECY